MVHSKVELLIIMFLIFLITSFVLSIITIFVFTSPIDNNKYDIWEDMECDYSCVCEYNTSYPIVFEEEDKICNCIIRCGVGK